MRTGNPPAFRLILAGILLAASQTACGLRGSGRAMEEVRNVPGFVEVDASGIGSVELIFKEGTADTIDIKLSGDDNIVPLVQTSVTDNTLRIHFDDVGSVYAVVPLSIVATVPALHKVTSRNSVDLKVRELKSSGFALWAEDSSDAELHGTVETLSITARNSADVNARSLKGKTVDVTAENSSDIQVCAEESLTVTARNSADVTYFCSPATVDKNAEDSADISAG